MWIWIGMRFLCKINFFYHCEKYIAGLKFERFEGNIETMTWKECFQRHPALQVCIGSEYEACEKCEIFQPNSISQEVLVKVGKTVLVVHESFGFGLF